jgi:hypothetical protein
MIDTAYEIFRDRFDMLMSPAKYPDNAGDFVQLAKLRRSLGLAPGRTPPEWEKACENYLSSPLSNYTVRDLAVRYAVFLRSPLDRYNKPLGVGYESSAKRQLRDNQEAVRHALNVIHGEAGDHPRGNIDSGTNSIVSRPAIRLERKTNRKGL